MYQLYSPLFFFNITNRDRITPKRERESRTSWLVTANYVSKRNSRVNGKFPCARTSTRLRSSSLFSLRAWPTIRKINLYLKFLMCCSEKTLHRYFKYYLNYLYITGKNYLSLLFLFCSFVFDIRLEEDRKNFLIKAYIKKIFW